MYTFIKANMNLVIIKYIYIYIGTNVQEKKTVLWVGTKYQSTLMVYAYL